MLERTLLVLLKRDGGLDNGRGSGVVLRSKTLELLTFLDLTHLGSRPDFEVVVFLEPVKVRVFLSACQHGLIKHLHVI